MTLLEFPKRPSSPQTSAALSNANLRPPIFLSAQFPHPATSQRISPEYSSLSFLDGPFAAEANCCFFLALDLNHIALRKDT